MLYSGLRPHVLFYVADPSTSTRALAGHLHSILDQRDRYDRFYLALAFCNHVYSVATDNIPC
jgi:hypothetical protein